MVEARRRFFGDVGDKGAFMCDFGEVGDVDSAVKKAVVVGEREGSRGIVRCIALSPAASDGCIGNKRCLVNDPAAAGQL